MSSLKVHLQLKAIKVQIGNSNGDMEQNEKV
jgi:hypothetical protein